MADPAQQQIDAARQRKGELTQQLNQLDQERNIVLDLSSYLEVINNAYKIILRYRNGDGHTRIILDQAVRQIAILCIGCSAF